MSHYEYALAIIMLAVTLSTFGLLSLLYEAHWKVDAKYAYVRVELTLGDITSPIEVKIVWRLYLDGRVERIDHPEVLPGLWIAIPYNHQYYITDNRVDSMAAFKMRVEALAAQIDIDGLKRMGCRVTVINPKENINEDIVTDGNTIETKNIRVNW